MKTNYRLKALMLEAVDNQLAENNPPIVTQTFSVF